MKATLLTIPQIIFSEEAWEESLEIVRQSSTKECSWYYNVKKIGKDKYYLEKPLLPSQKVSEGHCTMDTDDQIKFYEEGNTNLFAWGHTHVDMGVTPSCTDNKQLKSFIEDDCPYYIRIIFNKRGDTHISFADRYVIIEDCPFTVERNYIQKNNWKEIIKEKCISLIPKQHKTKYPYNTFAYDKKTTPKQTTKYELVNGEWTKGKKKLAQKGLEPEETFIVSGIDDEDDFLPAWLLDKMTAEELVEYYRKVGI